MFFKVQICISPFSPPVTSKSPLEGNAEVMVELHGWKPKALSSRHSGYGAYTVQALANPAEVLSDGGTSRAVERFVSVHVPAQALCKTSIMSIPTVVLRRNEHESYVKNSIHVTLCGPSRSIHGHSMIHPFTRHIHEQRTTGT